MKPYLVSATMVLGLSISGCGGPTLVPVEGAITLGEKPLANSTITLQRTDGPIEQRVYQAKTDTAGHYAISPSWSNALGAAPGKYNVFIVSLEPRPDADETTAMPIDPVPFSYRDGSLTLEVPEQGLLDANWDIPAGRSR